MTQTIDPRFVAWVEATETRQRALLALDRLERADLTPQGKVTREIVRYVVHGTIR